MVRSACISETVLPSSVLIIRGTVIEPDHGNMNIRTFENPIAVAFGEENVAVTP